MRKEWCSGRRSCGLLSVSRMAMGIFACAMVATSAPVVDFIVPAPYNFGQVLGTGQWSQSFTADSTNAAGAGVWVFSPPELAGEMGTVELRLYEGLPTGGSVLATGSASITLASAPQFYDVFWAPVKTTIGNAYYLQIVHSLPTGAAPTFAGNTYAGGTAYNNSVAFANFDAPIRLFTEPDSTGQIPEPSTFALLVGGLAALATQGFRKGRRCQLLAYIKPILRTLKRMR